MKSLKTVAAVALLASACATSAPTDNSKTMKPRTVKDDCGVFKFVHVWRKSGDEWKVTRAVSYDH